MTAPPSQPLTSSSLYHDSDSAVSTNQYSLEPPFIRLILLMVSQPLRITWGGWRTSQAQQGTTATTQPGLPPPPARQKNQATTAEKPPAQSQATQLHSALPQALPTGNQGGALDGQTWTDSQALGCWGAGSLGSPSALGVRLNWHRWQEVRPARRGLGEGNPRLMGGRVTCRMRCDTEGISLALGRHGY